MGDTSRAPTFLMALQPTGTSLDRGGYGTLLLLKFHVKNRPKLERSRQLKMLVKMRCSTRPTPKVTMEIEWRPARWLTTEDGG